MARYVDQLPTKQAVYAKIDEFVEEAYTFMMVRIPPAGTIYRAKGKKHLWRLRETDGKLLKVPNSSGRFKNSITKPGKLNMTRPYRDKEASGRIRFVVESNTLYDPKFQENYWRALSENVKTRFGNKNKYKNFWLGAYKLLLGNLQTYSRKYAHYSDGEINSEGLNQEIEP